MIIVLVDWVSSIHLFEETEGIFLLNSTSYEIETTNTKALRIVFEGNFLFQDHIGKSLTCFGTNA